MIYFSLPMFATNLTFNNAISNFLKFHPQACNFSNGDIATNYGNFPYSYWDGNVNNNHGGDIALYGDIMLIRGVCKKPIRLTCSNIYLEEKDLYDVHQNVVFDLLKDCGNFIEISDLQLYSYIKEKYPGYNFIFSENADLIHPFTEEILNTILEQNIFSFITLPKRLSENDDFLFNLKHKNKYEIIICDKCCCNNIEFKQECSAKEQQYQINFSNKTMYQNCDKINKYKDAQKDIAKINELHKMGFNYFKIDCCPIKDIITFNNFLVDLLIKPEYQKKFYQEVKING